VRLPFYDRRGSFAIGLSFLPPMWTPFPLGEERKHDHFPFFFPPPPPSSQLPSSDCSNHQDRPYGRNSGQHRLTSLSFFPPVTPFFEIPFLRMRLDAKIHPIPLPFFRPPWRDRLPLWCFSFFSPRSAGCSAGALNEGRPSLYLSLMSIRLSSFPPPLLWGRRTFKKMIGQFFSPLSSPFLEKITRAFEFLFFLHNQAEDEPRTNVLVSSPYFSFLDYLL